jgi:hypothetical protein
MNALTPTNAEDGADIVSRNGCQSTNVDWDTKIRAVNDWRGAAIQCFAKAEAAVSETLLTLAEAPRRGAEIKPRGLVGQRFEDLRVALEGPFAVEGARAICALDQFRDMEALRAQLCHGVATVAVMRNGNWLIHLKLLAFRARKAERSERTLLQEDAEIELAELKRRTRALCSNLGQLRKKVVG